MLKNKYRGITYPHMLDNKLVRWFWKKFMCKREMHLFDEVWSPAQISVGLPACHYLYCDACGLSVHIESFEEELIP